MSTFLRRTITAFWIVVFILGGFWLHPVSFFITGLVIITGGQREYYHMVRDNGASPQTIAGIITGIALYSVSTLVAAGFISKEYYLILIPLSLAIMISELYRKQDKPFDSLAHTFFAIFYVALPVSLFPYLAFSKTGIESLLPHGALVFSPGLIIGFILILWANDTGAYLTGAAFGRHRLMERTSQKIVGRILWRNVNLSSGSMAFIGMAWSDKYFWMDRDRSADFSNRDIRRPC